MLQRCRTPKPQKVLPGVLGEVPARGGVLGRVLGGVLGMLGGCSGGCSGPIFSAKTRRTSTLPSTPPSTFPSTPRAPSRAPHLGPALPRAPPGALFEVRGFGTSVAGRATRKNFSKPIFGHSAGSTTITHKNITEPNFTIFQLISVILVPRLPNRIVSGIPWAR